MFGTIQLCANNNNIMSKQISFDSFQNKITYKLLTFKSYV